MQAHVNKTYETIIRCQEVTEGRERLDMSLLVVKENDTG